jgi:polyisoprenoid-binding protein YceI
VKNSQWLLIVMVALSSRAAETYQLDASNTQVSFAVQHLGIEWVRARFADISGQFVVDPAGPASRVEVTVAMASLDCSEPRWNERLRSADWLDIQRYPQMTYRSNRIELGAQRAVADGELTLHGVTHAVLLNVTLLECSAPGSCRFAAHGRIKRSDYGLPHGFWTGGDQVEISITGSLAAAIGAAAAPSLSSRPPVAGAAAAKSQ